MPAGRREPGSSRSRATPPSTSCAGAGANPKCELDELPSIDWEPEQALEHIERRRTVRDALSGLPLREREVVLLKFHGQLSNAELAQALGISESNAGTRLHRALTRLRTSCIGVDRQEVA